MTGVSFCLYLINSFFLLLIQYLSVLNLNGKIDLYHYKSKNDCYYWLIMIIDWNILLCNKPLNSF